MRPTLRRVLPALAAFGVAVPAAHGAFTLPEPVPPPETNRHHRFALNLDSDRKKEVVFVFNYDQTGEGPATGFSVWDRRKTAWLRTQIRVIYGPGPGPEQSGLVKAWAGDLNSDGRDEIASRDSITASAGEQLTILRQKTRTSRTFKRLQVITGDQVVLVKRSGPDRVHALIKANHSADGRPHTEIWTWSRKRGKWGCAADCAGRPGG